MTLNNIVNCLPRQLLEYCVIFITRVSTCFRKLAIILICQRVANKRKEGMFQKGIMCKDQGQSVEQKDPMFREMLSITQKAERKHAKCLG